MLSLEDACFLSPRRWSDPHHDHLPSALVRVPHGRAGAVPDLHPCSGPGRGGLSASVLGGLGAVCGPHHRHLEPSGRGQAGDGFGGAGGPRHELELPEALDMDMAPPLKAGLVKAKHPALLLPIDGVHRCIECLAGDKPGFVVFVHIQHKNEVFRFQVPTDG